MTENEILNNRYQLIHPIGRGSFGEVWMANDLRLDIIVAVKVYAALDGKGITEFKDEFKNVYKLHHLNLLRPDHFDTVGDNPYLVMPYCPKSADALVGGITEHELWRFIRDVASGLAYLHDNDVIHRDIKPENILQDERGDYVISDFGLSTKMRSTLRQASMRQNDGFSGTIAYMAPELFTSKPTAVKATDVWALGVTIYEMATSELPFCGQGGCMLNVGAESPELDNTKWSSNLNEVMRLCLAKDTWDRPTAKDLAEYSKLVMNGDKRPWSQWKRVDKPKPVSKPRISLFTIIEMLIGGLSTVFVCFCLLGLLFHKDNDHHIYTSEASCDDYMMDLSLSGTANCYIVTNAGRYKFKTVKGNSSESIGSVVFCDVLWESFGTNKAPTIGDLVSNVSYDDDYIEFDATGRKGNAVIAAKDANGKILWSWHIWLTDKPEEQVYYNKAGTMMDRNLGATSAIPGDVGALGLLYQWGRKDPFLGSSSIRRNKEALSTISWPLPVVSTSNTGTIEYSITHPTTYITKNDDNGDWYYMDRGTDNIRWKSSKTIYDPCPAGWRVPDGDENGVWSETIGSAKEFVYSYNFRKKGMDFYSKFGDSNHIWYPASGYISTYGRHIEGVRYNGTYWSVSTNGRDAYCMSLDSFGYVNPSIVGMYISSQSYGFSVRCVKEQYTDSTKRNRYENYSIDTDANSQKPNFGLG